MTGLLPGTTYKLKLGNSWSSIPSELVHAVQYDFKPASVDPSQAGQMKLDDNNGVTVLLPHKDADEYSEFKGNKQPSSKECFLIVDNTTKTVYLEKISNTIRVKKYRVSKKPINKPLQKKEERCVSPVTQVKVEAAARGPSPGLVPGPTSGMGELSGLTGGNTEPSQPPPKRFKESEPTGKAPELASLVKSSGLSSESSGSLSDDSSNDSSDDQSMELKSDVLTETTSAIPPLPTPVTSSTTSNNKNTDLMDMLSQDLDLSDSDSDSDSD